MSSVEKIGSEYNYSLLPADPSQAQGVARTQHVFNIAQAGLDVKKDESILSKEAQADVFRTKGDNAWNAKNYKTAYFNYLQAKNLYQQLPKEASVVKKLMGTHYDLAFAATELRGERRLAASCIGVSATMLLVPAIFGIIRFKWCTPEWIPNETFRSYIDEGLTLADQFIESIRNEYKIDMNTDKKSVPEDARKSLGWAYNFKANFHSIYDAWVKVGCLFSCCFEGSPGNVDYSRNNKETRLSYLKFAKEWDSSNIEYESAYQKLDAAMKTPVVKVDVTIFK